MSPFADQLTNSSFFDLLMDILRNIASVRTPFLDAVMQGITFLGQETVFIIAAMLLLWCWDKKWGYRFLAFYFVGSSLNQILKSIFLIPRPWVIDPEFKIVESAREGASGYSFPSAHTQSASLILGGLALWIRKRWAYILAFVLSLAVAFSRMYLGVHTLLDTGVSLLLSFLILILFSRFLDKINDDPKSFFILILVCLAISVIFLLCLYLLPVKQYLRTEDYKNAFILVGTAIGFVIGWLIDVKWGHFDCKAVWWMQVIKIILGTSLVLAVRTLLKKLFGGNDAAPFLHGIRYAIMTMIAIGVVPFLFKPMVRWSEKTRHDI